MKLARFLLLPLLLVACEEPPDPQPEPAAATVAKPEPFDLDGYCTKMCERTTTCSMQAAEGSAALGGAKVEKALREARDESSQLTDACVTGCKATPVDEKNRGAALRAKHCLKADSCGELEKCLADS